MSINTQIQQINQVKQDIKQALTDKKVDMTGVPFTGYAGKIGEISLDLSTLQVETLEIFKTSGTTLEKTLDVAGKTIKLITMGAHDDRYTSAETKFSGIVYGSKDDGTTYEELLKIEKSETKVANLYLGAVANLGTRYNKLKVSMYEASTAYNIYARVNIYYE